MKSENNLTKKWKRYVTSIMHKNFHNLDMSEKYFKGSISESTCKAIENNWIKLLGLDYQIISYNLNKKNSSLGIGLDGKTEYNANRELIQRHYFRTILPNYCIGSTNLFQRGDEILEVNGLKIQEMAHNEVFKALRKLPNYFQIVIGRKIRNEYLDQEDLNESEEGKINGNVEYCELDEDDVASKCSTLRSITSNYSTTSRDFDLLSSNDNLQTPPHGSVTEYLRNIDGWRGPLVLEFRKRKESLGLALEEIKDPRTQQRIIVFKCIHSKMKAGKDGRVHVGDRILQVNGKSIDGVPFKKVCQWIKSAPKGRIIFLLCQPHFKPIGFDHLIMNPNELYSPTLDRSSAMPKLTEEEDDDEETACEVPPVPESLERHITIKRNEGKLGIFFEIVDEGKHGCRIKYIIDGLAKSDGRLKEGDYVTMISGINWRINDKEVLLQAIQQVFTDTDDYKISFVSCDDVNFHRKSYQDGVVNRQKPIPITYPEFYDGVDSKKMNSQEKVDGHQIITCVLTKEMDNQQIGISLSPSLNRPHQFVCIGYITPDSVADHVEFIKINDDLLSVNNVELEGRTVQEAGIILHDMWTTESSLTLRLGRMILNDSGDDCEDISELPKFVNKYPFLEQLPDLYLCVIKKSSTGLGLSVRSIGDGLGIAVDLIEKDKPAYKTGLLTSGDRFIMINNIPVSNCSYDTVVQILRSCKDYVGLIMERPKYLEFYVDVVKDEHNSLGINVAGGVDISSSIPVVQSIVSGSRSQFSLEICVDDQIIEAENISLLTMTHHDVIETLRATLPHTKLRLRRKLQYIPRNSFINQLELCDKSDANGTPDAKFIEYYRQECQMEIELSREFQRSTASLQDFYGLHIADVVIVNSSISNNEQPSIMGRYKLIDRIMTNSLAEFYAPNLRQKMPFLIAINGTPIDVNLSNEVIRQHIDNYDCIKLLLSTDVPYDNIHNFIQCDSPILLNKLETESSNSSVQELSETSKTLNNIKTIEEVEKDSNSSSSLNKESPEESCLSDRVASPILEIQEDSEENDGEESSSPLGIKLRNISIPLLTHTELGFHLYGGRQGGYHQEDLPLFVVNVEENSCNWPADRTAPYLLNGDQVLTMNGSSLSGMTVGEVDKMISSICTNENNNQQKSQLELKIIRLNK